MKRFRKPNKSLRQQRALARQLKQEGPVILGNQFDAQSDVYGRKAIFVWYSEAFIEHHIRRREGRLHGRLKYYDFSGSLYSEAS